MQAIIPSRLLRILFVEDHPETATVFRRALEARKHSVQVAEDLATAMTLAQRQSFDLLLCDKALPDGDGSDLLPRLRGEWGQSELKGIVFSAYGARDDIQRSRAAGYDAHVLKPVDLEELLAIIDEVANRGGDDPFRRRFISFPPSGG